MPKKLGISAAPAREAEKLGQAEKRPRPSRGRDADGLDGKYSSMRIERIHEYLMLFLTPCKDCYLFYLFIFIFCLVPPLQPFFGAR